MERNPGGVVINRRIVINVITFGVLAAVLVALLAVSVFRIRRTYAVDVVFADSGGVFTGQEVTYRGVTVGRVGEMRVVREGVRITLVIDQAFSRIPRELTARVMFKSAVGEQFVDLLPRTRSKPYLRGGDVIPIGRTELPVQQEELLRLLDGVLSGVPPEDFGRLVDTLGEGLGGRGDELHRALAALDPLTAVLAARVDELNRIARSGDRAGAAFDSTADAFVAASRHLRNVADSLGRSSDDLARLLRTGARNVQELASLVAARKAELDRTIANLATVTRISHKRIRSVDATLKWLPAFLTAAVNAYDDGRFRFARQAELPLVNPSCDYGTPHRDPADASPRPAITEFDCVEDSGAAGSGSWQRLFTDPASAPR